MVTLNRASCISKPTHIMGACFGGLFQHEHNLNTKGVRRGRDEARVDEIMPFENYGTKKCKEVWCDKHKPPQYFKLMRQ